MSLSSDLISQFAKITKPAKNESKESTAYGTIVDYNGESYVKLDGSDLLTPISTTADTKSGERVTVTIKDHTAVVTGNLSSPAARTGDVKELGTKISEFEIVIADKVSVEQLEAEVARIDTLVSENVTIRERLTASEAEIDTLQADNVTVNEKLTAHDASIENLDAKKIDAEIVESTYATIENFEATDAKVNNLQATYGEFKDLATDKFTAIDADIKKLDTEKLSATDADLKYANIDFSNIGKAAIEQFYATSGIIKDLVIGDTSVTGKLVGVTITGDLIEGGTVKADKLVVLGTDGLYYKLNTDGVSTTAEQTEYNSLNGSVITAKSITAEKVNVDDLVAFDATIGGFNITDSSLYSGAKSSVDNTTRGIYLDKNGQISFGDGTNFIRYYKGSDGQYKLEISADSISINNGVSGESTSLNTVIEDVKNIEDRVGDCEINIDLNKKGLEICAIRTDVERQISDASDSLESKIDNGLSGLESTVKKNQEDTVNGIQGAKDDIQSLNDTVSQYFKFDPDGLTIMSGENSLKLRLSNDKIEFIQNGITKGWWDGNDFHTGNVYVDVSERAQFGNFAFVPRSDGSLMFLKVSDNQEVSS